MNTIKQWLAENNYGDILRRINSVEKGWRDKGTKTRRDWGDVLAGNKNGSAKIIEGVKFPVLSAAQKRKGWPITKNSICQHPGEQMPPIVQQSRWEKFPQHCHDEEKQTA